MPGNPLVRFDEGRVGRTVRCRPLSYSTARAEHVRRDPALRGRPHIETVAELTRARLERQWRAFHNYVRAAVLGHFIHDRIDAATDALADPPIACCPTQMLIAHHDLL